MTFTPPRKIRLILNERSIYEKNIFYYLVCFCMGLVLAGCVSLKEKVVSKDSKKTERDLASARSTHGISGGDKLKKMLEKGELVTNKAFILKNGQLAWAMNIKGDKRLVPGFIPVAPSNFSSSVSHKSIPVCGRKEKEEVAYLKNKFFLEGTQTAGWAAVGGGAFLGCVVGAILAGRDEISVHGATEAITSSGSGIYGGLTNIGKGLMKITRAFGLGALAEEAGYLVFRKGPELLFIY